MGISPHESEHTAVESAGESLSLASVIRGRRKAWTAEELSDLLSISTKTIYAMVKKNRMPSFRIGSLVRFDPALTAAWMESKPS